ncbi:alpha-2-macroglobulin family protein [Marinovum sp. 2_MG-2023]|uniref:alpha-2-macroglobulin family protein n=1 Tax=unclassified Marinovum TaxID=2647166 RepID=UPI0026E42CC7|nr:MULTISPECIES: alpha-2-macroglobulin family protein [unclassified Marinovum]MDO6730659.1 alpha-2-macroglobulin family protein [Marinovum sp. 2_MG-2023]MDO6778810.1 alpha-2-macroglobulin family protein [Marinovum sp. 1_MG-2023]
MRRVFAALMSLLCTVPVFVPVAAQSQEQELIPDRRVVVSRDMDFFGSDLQALFDTNMAACQQVCLNDPSCKAFTFNSRSNACFPKSAVSERQAYEGAISAVVVDVDPAVQDRAEGRVNDLNFLRKRDVDAAMSQARDLGVRHMGGKWSVDVLLKAARDKEAENDLGNALHWVGAALAQNDAADLWVDYARLALANEAVATSSSNRRRFAATAVAAGVNGYLRAPNDPGRIAALLILAEGLEESGRGRDMVPTLRLAESIQPRGDVVAALDAAINKYGFRITEHRTESDKAEPRICVTFSEDLVRTGVDYAPYVRLPDPGLVVSASGRDVCVGGVEHGHRYTITFREGLPAASGEEMVKDVTITQYVRDRSPSVAFTGRSYVLPRSSDAGLPIETVNLTEVDLTLRRVSDRNLLRAIQDSFFGEQMNNYLVREFDREVGETIWQGVGEVEQQLNLDVTTRLPMGDALADQPPGIYALTARVPSEDEYSDNIATQWFVLSDLGLASMSGSDGLHVFIRGLGDAKGKSDVSVQLISQANRVLAEAKSDASGHVQFDPGLTRGTQGAAPALLVARTEDDIAFLSLKDPAFDLSDRGVEGREPAGSVDVFLATDRGAYRAGEVIEATALARDSQARGIDGLPLVAVLTRPDGVEYSRHLSNDGLAGGHVFSMPIGATVPRGTWRIEVHSDPDTPALVTKTVLVEDFLPERIDFDLSLPEGRITASDTPDLSIEAKYLFGAPGADLPAEIRVRLSRASGIEGWDGFTFGRHDITFDPRTRYMDGGLRSGADGTLSVPLEFPAIEGDAASLPMTAEVVVSMSEGSGRPVERRLSRDLAASGPVIGIKPLFDGVVKEGSEARFQLIGLDAEGAASDMPVKWTLNRVRTTYEWYRLYGQWNWEPTVVRTEMASGTVTLGNAPVEIGADVDWGNYELVVERDGGTYVAASTEFWAGWYVPADATSTPDTLELSLDKPAYRSGEVATLRLVPRYAGTALITVMSHRLIDMQTVAVTEGENTIPLTVTDEWGAGAYVSATVIRPMDAPAGQNPARSLGLAHASIDPGAKALDVTLITGETSKPRGPLTATVQVDGITEGETAYVTVAATDLGILNITGFQSPDPQGHYFGQRKLGVEMRDLYGRLIDGLDGSMGRIRSGGDGADGARFNSPPPTEDLVARFSGPVTIGPDGRAEVSFDIPEFNGTVRLAAVAWSSTGVGQAEKDVLVRDPVVVTASLPRFLAPGDSSRMLLEVVHAEGPAGRMGLDITAQGVTLDATAIPSDIDLGDLGKASFAVPITAISEGDHAITVALTTPDGLVLRKSLTVPVRNNDPEVSQTRRFSLAAGETFTFDDNVFAGLRLDTASALVAAGPLARFDAPRLLASLDRYPYGCTEQITSQAMPLLYLSSVTDAMGLTETARIQERIDQTVARILTRQAPNGAFGLWRAQSGDFWLDAYVSDFLSRARASDFAVPDLAFRQAMDNLKNRVNYAPDFDDGGEDIAYALMVLAREGAAAVGDLRYYADVKGGDFATPLAAAQLGAALAMYGDQTRADRMFTIAVQKLGQRTGPESPLFRVDYGTDLRDAAGLLSLAVEAGSNAIDREVLIQRISDSRPELSTQEQAWSLLAAHAMVADPTASNVLLDDAPVEGPMVRRFLNGDAPRTITNNGSTATSVTLTTFGKPSEPVDQGGYGYRIERRYYDMDGAEVTGAVALGDRLVTVLRVIPAEETGARLMINDPLPAGFEIDNPNLLRSGDIRALDWLKPKQAEHTEFRADRFLAAVDHRGDKAFELAYIVRAISPGAFHHPAAVVEDMYRPQYRARTASGQLTVAP